ncbi:MAG TPA: hypoxanthine/guanine phosphoribosyltransferase [Thermoplasmata archaeon]|nr:hypoxanthine/guanine phosphoribosyltransferase [Thermoplasmata archaeon]
MSLERLRASLRDSPVVRFGDYDYFVHPITDGIPLGDPLVLEEVLDELAARGDWSRCDKIVTAESMGFPLATGLSTRVQKPYVFIRKRRYGLPGEVSLRQTTGYSKTDMFINNVRRGDRVVFVDDVISTGGTLVSIVTALRAIGAEVVDVLIVFEKTREKARIESDLHFRIKTLLAIDVVGGKVVERT